MFDMDHTTIPEVPSDKTNDESEKRSIDNNEVNEG